jgi:hypothetical protein
MTDSGAGKGRRLADKRIDRKGWVVEGEGSGNRTKKWGDRKPTKRTRMKEGMAAVVSCSRRWGG